MRIAVSLVLLAIVTTAAYGTDSAPSASDDARSWKRTDDTLALLCGDEMIWQFHFGAEQTKPFFHPVKLPGAPPLTWEAPPDHPWHHGLWFSWKLINGVNYWEEDRQSGLSDGRTTWKDVKIEQGDDFAARIEIDVAYHLAGKPPVLTEHRIIEVMPPGADGGYHIDWTATFTAKADKVVLDRTPLPNEPNGRSFGGYAGLSVRLAKSAAQFEAVDSERLIKQQGERTRIKARAVDYAGTIGKTVGGIAILDHPQNLNAPSPWYIIRNTRTPMTYFSPAVIHDSPHTLAGGESFTLRYRILVHRGRWNAATLKQHHQRFAEN